MSHKPLSQCSCPMDVQWTSFTTLLSYSHGFPMITHHLTTQLSYWCPMNNPHLTAVLWMSQEHLHLTAVLCMSNEHLSQHSCHMDVPWTPLSPKDVPWTSLTTHLSYGCPISTLHNTSVLWISHQHLSPYDRAVLVMNHQCPMNTSHYTMCQCVCAHALWFVILFFFNVPLVL